jgi:hypothetical protein
VAIEYVQLRPVPLFPRYFAGSDGLPYSTKYDGDQPRPMKSRPDKDGYRLVTLCANRRRKTLRVHVLVLLAWHGAKPPGAEARHRDNDRANNRPTNLLWGTKADNAKDIARSGTAARGSKNGFARLTEALALNVKLRLRDEPSARKVAREFGLSVGCVRAIKDGRTWTHVVVPESG